jgi:hypothetical protein
MRLILMLVAVSACAAGTRSTRVLGEQEYVAFADRPTGGFAPLAPPDCADNADDCRGQWLAPVQIGERGGSIERVLQTQTGFVIYVRPSCDAEPAPNWTLMLRKPVMPVKVIKLGAGQGCDPPVARSASRSPEQPGAPAGAVGDGTM